MTWYDDNKHLFFKKHDTSSMVKDVVNYRKGSGKLFKLLGTFFEEEMYKCKGRRGDLSPMEALHNDEVMSGIMEYINSKPKFYIGNDVENIKSFFRNAQRIASKVSNFPIKEATTIFNKYSEIGNTIYDPSCGFGSRLCAGILNGRMYIGTDPNISLVNKLEECVKWCKNNVDDVGSYKIYPHGSEIFIPELENTVDLCFTSPPYYKLEKYSDDETQSIIKYSEYDEWINGYSKMTLDNCVRYTKTNGIIAINIKNSNDGKKYKLFDDWFKILDDNINTKFVDILDMKQVSKRQYGDKHFTGVVGDMGEKESIMVFMKTNYKTKYTAKEGEVKESKTLKEEPQCQICGSIYKGMTKEQHESRPFHQNSMEA